MTILSKNDQKGRSMVEMLGVLAIIGVLSVGGISGYSKAMAKFKLTKAQDQISMLLMNIRTAFATSPSYEGLNNGNAVAFAIAPGDMYAGTVSQSDNVARLNNAFGGAAHVFACGGKASEDVGSNIVCSGHDENSKDQFFGIAMTGLGREACVNLLSSDWGTDGLVSVQVAGDGNTASEDDTFAAADLPISMMTAGSACGGYGSNTTIIWTYY